MEQLTFAHRLSCTINSNWKNVVDNFLECYHCHIAHKDFVSLADAHAEAERIHPLGTIGTPTDMANLVHWLVSDEARYATGQLWVLDGGLSAQIQQMRF